jgi:cobalt-zinc-cadmium resistance protein CzcA
MVENLHHRFHQSRGNLGQPHVKASVAHRAAIEVGRPIAFATVIIVAVFLPLFLMGGIEGLLFRPLAITVAAAMLVSLVLSLTLTPVLGLRLLVPAQGEERTGEVRFVSWIKAGYVPLLEWCLHNRLTVLVLAGGLLIPSAVGLSVVGRDFMPKLDEGAWVISTTTPAETSLEENDRITRQVEMLLLQHPDVAGVVRRNGRPERAIGCVHPVNTGHLIVNLKPKAQRSRPTERILAEVREQVSGIAGMALAFTQPLQLRLDEGLEGTPAPLQVKLFGPDIAVLAQKGTQVEALMRATPGCADVKMEQVTGIPQVQIRIDRVAAARHGVSVAALSEVISLAIGGEELTQVWKDQRSYGVLARYPDSIRGDVEAVGGILVDTPAGGQVPLSDVAEVTMSDGPNVIWHEAMSRRLSIDAGIEGRDLGSVVTDLKKGMEGIELPPGYHVVFGGQYQNQQRAMRSLMLASAIALAIVFMLLYLALRSGRQALMILATVPSAFIGGVLSLLVTGESLNVSSAVGFIALFGIAVQNSLVLLTQTGDFIREGHGPDQAIRLASVQRLRPKLMTAACAGLGLLPILLSGGVGAEIEKPLAIVMVGGLVTSTLFTLLVLPVVYLTVERLTGRQRGGAGLAEKA